MTLRSGCIIPGEFGMWYKAEQVLATSNDAVISLEGEWPSRPLDG